MKKVISLVLTMALLLSMLPVVAKGAEDFQLQVRTDTLELNSPTAGYPQIDAVCNYSGKLYVENYDSVADAWSDINKKCCAKTEIPPAREEQRVCTASFCAICWFNQSIDPCGDSARA